MTDESKPFTLLEGEVLEAARTLNRITAVEEPELEERKAKAKALLANALTTPGFEAGDADHVPLVMVRKGTSRFDGAKAKDALPRKAFESICTDMPVLSTAADVLTPAEYRSICIPVPNEELARATLPAERFALLCVKVPDAKLAEQMLPPALHAKCMDQAPPVIMAVVPRKRK